MRLFYVDTAQAVYGGLERIIAEKMKMFSVECGYEVHYVTINQGSIPMPYPLDSSINHHDLGVNLYLIYHYKGIMRFIRMIQKELRFIIRLQRLIRNVHPDVIIIPRLEIWEVFMCSGRIPVVFESHNMCKGSSFELKTYGNRQREKFLRLMVRRAEKIVSLTEGDAADWSYYNSHVCVIPNIVHLNQTGHYSSLDSKSAIFVGRSCFQKDIPSLLQIWRLVHRRHPDWELHIYGHDSDGKGFLKDDEMNLANIFVHAPTSSIMDRFLDSSMLLMTSVYEPFGLVLPESMSCGLPVITFDCPYGPAEIITDGEDGFLIRNRDIQAFADRVCQLIDSKELRLQMGKKAIASSLRYSSQRVLPQWKMLFNEVLEK